jgi:hypothetical protein
VVSKLFDFDNGGGPNSSRILDVNSSEILYGREGKDGSTQGYGSPLKDDINMSIDGIHHKDS